MNTKQAIYLEQQEYKALENQIQQLEHDQLRAVSGSQMFLTLSGQLEHSRMALGSIEQTQFRAVKFHAQRLRFLEGEHCRRLMRWRLKQESLGHQILEISNNEEVLVQTRKDIVNCFFDYYIKIYREGLIV